MTNPKEQQPSSDKDLTAWVKLVSRFQLIWKLMLDREVPIPVKLIPVFGILYLIFPFDIAPDVIPGLGQLDDIGVLLLASKLFVDFSPKEIVEKHRYLIRKNFGAIEKDDDGIVIVRDDV